jgi:hypothetical protein
MEKHQKFLRAILYITLLVGFCAGTLIPRLEPGDVVHAAPMGVPLLGCPASTIAQWTFTGNVVTPSTGSGNFFAGSGITGPTYPTGEVSAEDPSISFSSWNTLGLDNTAFVEFGVNTTGKDNIGVNFK